MFYDYYCFMVIVPFIAKISGISHFIFPEKKEMVPKKWEILPWDSCPDLSHNSLPLFGRLHDIQINRDCLSDDCAHVADTRDQRNTLAAVSLYDSASNGPSHTICLKQMVVS